MGGRRAPRRLGPAIEELASALAPQTLLADVQRCWPFVVGPTVARNGRPVAERRGKLTIACRSAVWAQELDLLGPDVVRRLNEELGTEAVSGLSCRASGFDGAG